MTCEESRKIFWRGKLDVGVISFSWLFMLKEKFQKNTQLSLWWKAKSSSYENCLQGIYLCFLVWKDCPVLISLTIILRQTTVRDCHMTDLICTSITSVISEKRCFEFWLSGPFLWATVDLIVLEVFSSNNLFCEAVVFNWATLHVNDNFLEILKNVFKIALKLPCSSRFDRNCLRVTSLDLQEN